MTACPVVTRAQFLARALAYVGTPRVHQGRVPGHGMDCPAPLICAARECGLVPATFDVTGYDRAPDGVSLKAFCDAHLTPIDLNDVQPCDVLMCSWQHGSPQHLGIYLGNHMRDARLYWLEVAARVRVSRLVFGDRYMQMRHCYRIPGVMA